MGPKKNHGGHQRQPPWFFFWSNYSILSPESDTVREIYDSLRIKFDKKPIWGLEKKPSSGQLINLGPLWDQKKTMGAARGSLHDFFWSNYSTFSPESGTSKEIYDSLGIKFD